MTRDEYRAIREALGLSRPRLAALIVSTCSGPRCAPAATTGRYEAAVGRNVIEIQGLCKEYRGRRGRRRADREGDERYHTVNPFPGVEKIMGQNQR